MMPSYGSHAELRDVRPFADTTKNLHTLRAAKILLQHRLRDRMPPKPDALHLAMKPAKPSARLNLVANKSPMQVGSPPNNPKPFVMQKNVIGPVGELHTRAR